MVRRGRNNYFLNMTGHLPFPDTPPPCGGFSMQPLGSPHMAYLFLSKAQFPSPSLYCICFGMLAKAWACIPGHSGPSRSFSEVCPHTSFHHKALIHPYYRTSLLFWTLTQKVQLPPFLLSVSLLRAAAKIYSEAVPLSFSQTLIKCPRAFIPKFFL